MKRRFLLLAAFALMALLTPLGAKGQQQTIRQVRQLADTYTPVTFTGTVIYKDQKEVSTIYMQNTDAYGITCGMRVVYNGNVSISVGDIITVEAEKVSLADDHVYINSSDVNRISVQGHGNYPEAQVHTLQALKEWHYPATPWRIMNDQK